MKGVMKNIVEIRDSRSRTTDRFTVVYRKPYGEYRGEMLYHALAMSEHPEHPQGFAQHCGALPGPHLGREIKFEELPEPCRQKVLADLGISEG